MLETLKNIAKDKKKEKLIYILVLCIVLFISFSYIFKDNKAVVESKVATETALVKTTNINTELEDKLAKILSQINGIEDVSVMITYTADNKINPLYNTKEEVKDNVKTTDKQVVYNEEGSNKMIVVESTETPKVEGVIIVAKGASNIDIRSKIATAVSNMTSVAIYKVQVFEKKG